MAQLATKKINNAKAWTSDEEERLRKLIISNAPVFDIAADLGRTVVAVRTRVAALPRNFWTPEEDNRLRMLIVAGEPIEFIAAELKRSAKAARDRAYGLR